MDGVNQKQAFCTRMVAMIGACVLLLLMAIGVIAQYWDQICDLFGAVAMTIGIAWEDYSIDRPIFFWISWVVCFVCVLYTAWCICILQHDGKPKFDNILILSIVFFCSSRWFFCSYSHSLPPFQQVAELFVYFEILVFVVLIVAVADCKWAAGGDRSDKPV